MATRRKRRWVEGKEKQYSFFSNQQGVYRVKCIVDVDHRDRYNAYTLLDKVFTRFWNFDIRKCRNIRMKRCRGTLNKFCVTFTALINEDDLKYYIKNDRPLKINKIK